MPATTIQRPPEDPDQRFRLRCAERLSDQMEAHGVNRKELVRRLADAGHDVSLQSVSYWLTGSNLPRPYMQVAIAKALGVRPRSIFDIEDAA